MQNYDADEELQISATNMGIPMNPDLPVLAFADNDFDNGHYGGGNIDNNSDGNGSTDEDEDKNQWCGPQQVISGRHGGRTENEHVDSTDFQNSFASVFCHVFFNYVFAL